MVHVITHEFDNFNQDFKMEIKQVVSIIQELSITHHRTANHTRQTSPTAQVVESFLF